MSSSSCFFSSVLFIFQHTLLYSGLLVSFEKDKHMSFYPAVNREGNEINNEAKEWRTPPLPACILTATPNKFNTLFTTCIKIYIYKQVTYTSTIYGTFQVDPLLEVGTILFILWREEGGETIMWYGNYVPFFVTFLT